MHDAEHILMLLTTLCFLGSGVLYLIWCTAKDDIETLYWHDDSIEQTEAAEALTRRKKKQMLEKKIADVLAATEED